MQWEEKKITEITNQIPNNGVGRVAVTAVDTKVIIEDSITVFMMEAQYAINKQD